MQILVVVANIQMRTLKTEVGKGSAETSFGHGLLDPKIKVNSFSQELVSSVSKGNQVNIPEVRVGLAATQSSLETSTQILGRVIFSF